MSRFIFGPFELDAASGRLTRAGEPVSLPARHLDVLAALLGQARSVVSKDALVDAAWRGVAVTDNSLEQAISALRKALGADDTGAPLIQTVPRQGYRFAGEVQRTAARASDAALDALMAPFRAFVEGRAALETLAVDQIGGARAAFERTLAASPDSPSAHVGLATACAMQFEMTRADRTPDVAALRDAVEHAREACRLDPHYGEAWATLGFALERTGSHLDAVAALTRAAGLEPDNWRHHLRLASVGWGEARLRSARRTLALLPGFPLAHWLAATVHVARQALDEAERELTAGCAALANAGGDARLSGVALEWLLGLICLARGDEDQALHHFDRELEAERSGHLYGRECCANVWYAIGAVRLRRGNTKGAAEAFERALERIAGHAPASAALRFADPARASADAASSADRPRGPVDVAIVRAVALSLSGQPVDAAAVIDRALDGAEPGSHGWLVPVEPILRVPDHVGAWAPALARLRNRAA